MNNQTSSDSISFPPSAAPTVARVHRNISSNPAAHHGPRYVKTAVPAAPVSLREERIAVAGLDIAA